MAQPGTNEGTPPAASMTMHMQEAMAKENSADLDPVQEYIKAMHIFVEFQQEYIHNPDVRNMASQQEGYIKAQTKYISYLLSLKK